MTSLGRSGLALVVGAGLIVASLGAGSAQAQDKPDPLKGEQVAEQICAACHAADGNSPTPANPKIAGQHYGYLLKQLQEFKLVDGKPGKRNSAIMAGFASNLSDAEARDVAAHFAAQTLKPSAAKDKTLVELGQQIYRGGIASKNVPSCAGCHGPSGAGIPARYPALAGQFADYTTAQLTAFRQGTRSNSVEMADIAARLLDTEIKALAEYIAGMR